MSEKQFEECSLSEASHVEVNGKVKKLGNKEIATECFCGDYEGLRWLIEDAFIPIDMFSILGIKPLREVKPEPIEFEATFAKYDDNWHPLYSLDDGVSYQHCKVAKFKCVEILKEEDGA